MSGHSVLPGDQFPRIFGNKIIDVGPRSAHIANLHYTSFAENNDFSDIEIEKLKPIEGDPDDYLALNKHSEPNKRYTITPTGASNYLGLVKDIGHGVANLEAVKSCLESYCLKIKSICKGII
jgi:N-methylhydantoinase A